MTPTETLSMGKTGKEGSTISREPSTITRFLSTSSRRRRLQKRGMAPAATTNLLSNGTGPGSETSSEPDCEPEPPATANGSTLNFGAFTEKLTPLVAQLFSTRGVIEQISQTFDQYGNEVSTFGKMFGKEKDKDRIIERLEITNEENTRLANKKRVQLETELRELKSEFVIEAKPNNLYDGGFRSISDKIGDLAIKHFKSLPEDVILESDDVQRSLGQSSAVFRTTPISGTKVSEFLRLSAVRHIISESICKHIFQPPFKGLSEDPEMTELLERLSQKLSGMSDLSESVWRTLTLKGLGELGALPVTKPDRAKTVVDQVTYILGPLIIESNAEALRKELTGIVEECADLWTTAQKDRDRIEFRTPTRTSTTGWHVEQDEEVDQTPIPPGNTVRMAAIDPLCLFPRIVRVRPGRSAEETVHEGIALYPDSRALLLGKIERHDLKQKLVNARREVLRLRTPPAGGHSRGNSLASPTNFAFPDITGVGSGS